MLIVPLGDDVDHRDFPIGGVLLTLANVAVSVHLFRLMLDSPDGKEVMEFFRTWAIVPTDFAHKRYIGILSHMFLHGGLMHLLGNMFCFWAFVHTLEGSLGTIRLVVLYLFWGVVGGLMHVAANWGSEIPMVARSGAIAGMMGAYWIAFGPLTTIRTGIFLGWRPIVVNVPAGAFTVIWLLMQLFGLASAEEGGAGVAWFAHLGGFLAGGITMLFFKNEIHSRLVVRDDYVGFESTPNPRAATLAAAVPQADDPPTECPHCHASLGDAQRLAPNLLRCSNPTCARCIYLEGVAVG